MQKHSNKYNLYHNKSFPDVCFYMMFLIQWSRRFLEQET